jgi:hypothetical protein
MPIQKLQLPIERANIDVITPSDFIPTSKNNKTPYLVSGVNYKEVEEMLNRWYQIFKMKN